MIDNAASRLGSRNPRAKINEEDVKLIRELRKSGLSRRQVAEKFEVGYYTIAKIDQGLTWIHV